MNIEIYLVGQLNLQNQLLKCFLDRELEIECRCGGDLTIVPPMPDSKDKGFSLVLWDCISNSVKLLRKELENGFLPMHAGCCFALYNFGPDATFPRSMIEKGVRGVFFEDDLPDMIAKGIRKISEGELWFSRKTMTQFILERPAMELSESLRPHLTAREKEILAYLATGKSNQEITDALCVSPHTVKTHVYNIFQKIGVSNRLQAALWAGKHL